MIPDRELEEYRTLLAAAGALRERFQKRKEELSLLLDETAALRKETLLVLAKANRLTRHLTGGQRYTIGLSYHLGEINARIDRINQSSLLLSQSSGLVDNGKVFAEGKPLPEIRENYGSRGELRQKEVTVLGMIDELKSRLLKLDLLELRCRELLESVRKALETFRCEFRNIRRNIYPFGILSSLYRTLRVIRGSTYFSFRDLKDITYLGSITAAVLRIADTFESPIRA